ncbi:MAG: hypothetical protein KAR32_05110 [Candidatus Omnitrophica bacterium]|nr:hypothetical protein [Candidatus Omnitrophota bacterium]
MSQKFIRVYKKMNIDEIKQHLLIYGDLSAQCANCQAMDLKLDMTACPKCEAEFKYITFRNVRNHLPKLQKINEATPDIQFVDFDDYKRSISEMKARDFLR